MKERIRSTTILCVRRNAKVVLAGDGQVTLGQEVLKASAKKLRRLYSDKILAGFAGSTADGDDDRTVDLVGALAQSELRDERAVAVVGV